MTAESWPRAHTRLAERAPIYAWLSRLLACEITDADWEMLRSDAIRSVLIEIEPALERDLDRALSVEMEERFAEEFARLFLLPGGVPPFASIWFGRRSDKAVDIGGSDAALAARSRELITSWASHGFQVLGRRPVTHEPWGRLPLDHLAVLLDLVAQAVFARPTHSDDPLASQLERELLEPSLPAFGARLAREARVPIYRALGQLIAEIESFV